jgi:polar amino acid transport system permease protein
VTDWQPSDRELERRRVRRQQRTRSVLVASGAIVLVVAGLVTVLVSAPGWDRFRETFFDWGYAKQALPEIRDGFWLNVKLFLICEVAILALGLAVALARTARSPLLAPFRLLAVVYVDIFRGVPTVLLILMLGFGVPALRLEGLTDDRYVWAGVALVLSYGAYVAEVFRSGIDSVHPSQVASAQALGLSHGQSLRHVVVPQAVRRVVPPLLNDFVSLQKDTALVASVGLVEALRQAQVYSSYHFNFASYLVAAAFFVALTIPLARLTDWLGRRYARRERAVAR